MKTEEKFLEITTEIDKLLTTLCDAALKKDGIGLLGSVNQLISSIKTMEAE